MTPERLLEMEKVYMQGRPVRILGSWAAKLYKKRFTVIVYAVGKKHTPDIRIAASLGQRVLFSHIIEDHTIGSP